MSKRIILPLILCLTLFSSWASAAGILQAFGPSSMQSIVEKHKGKPFVLFIWSLDCVYCQASLDNLSQAKRDVKTLTIVTVSTDLVDDPQASALMQKRLAALHMTEDAWAFGSASPEKLKYALDPKWYGEKPRSYWYNAQGERTAYSGVLDASTIDKFYRRVSK